MNHPGSNKDGALVEPGPCIKEKWKMEESLESVKINFVKRDPHERKGKLEVHVYVAFFFSWDDQTFHPSQFITVNF